MHTNRPKCNKHCNCYLRMVPAVCFIATATVVNISGIKLVYCTVCTPLLLLLLGYNLNVKLLLEINEFLLFALVCL